MKGQRIWRLTRFRPGIGEMAEGAQVRAATEAEALEKARRLFSEESCRRDTFKVDTCE